MKMPLHVVLHKLRFFFIPYLIILTICLIIKLTESREDIYFLVNKHHNIFGDYFFSYATDFGSGLAVPVIACILLFYSYRNAFLLVSSFILTVIVSQAIKFAYHAPRPTMYFKAQIGKLYLVKGIHMLSWNSFPSGHTVQAFTLATVLTYITPNRWLGFVYLLVAIFIGYSRMYLSQHFFEDVTAGSMIGVMCTVMWITFIDGKEFLHTKKWTRGSLRG
ncbi:phosphatase PAP2 family protein [Mucilaginibacter ginkgonis]|uniref:Phosphatase PAP2 family protein n=1 Tax=Mucilaginibacter ginkgonis TaxID=2682091 RepID=A0A6I4I262_9SPHI|nr:phosphatase PAP2 family protein [Mucilaginibacter ginkgonis]QQL48489.1 phosphatase PAP2 family protein [Mucilaginibacter ginkgonis]